MEPNVNFLGYPRYGKSVLYELVQSFIGQNMLENYNNISGLYRITKSDFVKLLRHNLLLVKSKHGINVPVWELRKKVVEQLWEYYELYENFDFASIYLKGGKHIILHPNIILHEWESLAMQNYSKNLLHWWDSVGKHILSSNDSKFSRLAKIRPDTGWQERHEQLIEWLKEVEIAAITSVL
jgi:hypothetical protein